MVEAFSTVYMPAKKSDTPGKLDRGKSVKGLPSRRRVFIPELVIKNT
jgi:hypothetical protein|tara:strand:+ start:457 stop:597 length:141 start_codon:yes stop_codon:yes gene_type:complete